MISIQHSLAEVQVLKIRDEIQELLDSNLSAYRIAKESGVAQAVITKLRNGDRKIENLTVESGQKLMDYWHRVKK